MSAPDPDDAKTGLVAGGRGEPEDHLLEDGQEEVFAREEVERGRIEHHVQAGASPANANSAHKQIAHEAIPAAELNRAV